MKMLLVVDMQKDFIDGALGTKEAQAIVPAVVEKIRSYQKDRERIVFTMDTHGENYLETQEGKNLPVPHCIKGTAGWELCEQIRGTVNLSEMKIYQKETFGSSEYALDWEKGCYADVTEVEIIGLCTDICVISNAMLTKAFAPEIKVTVDASCCAGVTPQSHENALAAMKMCQIYVKP
ncbi:cysteine hydrolase family protein [Marvinbryantia formatexigens]|nr:isochorismatase family cysteine hydrolase [Marvinbryantia formatexigens]UWO25538.1 cysteine hydrolase [Marvinbryantia formatexigens DSM 14469]SDG20957.1 Nicotinamidase-related amidase [Marvinbryantia formatexigens]